MERVVFIVEDTGAQLRCLLNPETVLLRRQAGVGTRRSGGGLVTGTELADDPLHYSGGGRTELTLDLLFDVDLADPALASGDVRDLTGPLWDLAENRHQGDYGTPPLCRFFWGKRCNFPGVVSAVAERLECFSAEGVPRRSWLRMRLLRVQPPERTAPRPLPVPSPAESTAPAGLPEQVRMHELVGGAAAEGGERLDQLAYRYYGDASRWRELAASNGVDDPMHLAAGQLLQIPPLPALSELG